MASSNRNAQRHAADQYVKSQVNRSTPAGRARVQAAVDKGTRKPKFFAHGSDEASRIADMYGESNDLMRLAGMSNHAKFANGGMVGRVDPLNERDEAALGGGGGRGGDGGYGARRAAAAAALAAQMGLFQQAEDAGRSNAFAATGNINSIYDELAARLGQHRSGFNTQAAALAQRSAADQAAAAQGLNDQLGYAERALAAQFGGNQLQASLADGNMAQMAALRAAMGQRHQLDAGNLARTAQIGDESFGQRIADGATARAASQQQVQNNLGALLQDLAAQRAQAQAAAAGVV